MPLKPLVSLAAFCSTLAVFSGARAEELNIHFKTTPRIELLRPFADPIDLSLLVTGADGRPLFDVPLSTLTQAFRKGLEL